MVTNMNGRGLLYYY